MDDDPNGAKPAHPLPANEEARGYQIPEDLQRKKGLGDDAPGEDGGEDPRGSDKDPIQGRGTDRQGGTS